MPFSSPSCGHVGMLAQHPYHAPNMPYAPQNAGPDTAPEPLSEAHKIVSQAESFLDICIFQVETLVDLELTAELEDKTSASLDTICKHTPKIKEHGYVSKC